MAEVNERPTLDIVDGAKILKEDLPKVLSSLNVGDLKDLGWRLVGNNTLLIPMVGKLIEDSDSFLLRLNFLTNRDWPPSAQFVNPETNEFVYPEDSKHVPKITAKNVQTHINYRANNGNKTQLICSSVTFEFYDVLHSVEPKNLWKSTFNFYFTVLTIERALKTNYSGRYE